MRSVPCSLGRYSGFDQCVKIVSLIFFSILICFSWVSWILASNYVGSVCGQKSDGMGVVLVEWYGSTRFPQIGFEISLYLHFSVYWSRFVDLISNRRYSSSGRRAIFDLGLGSFFSDFDYRMGSS